MKEEKVRLEEQIDLLYKKYLQATSLKQARIIYESINTLLYAYTELFEEELTAHKTYRINTDYLIKILERKGHKNNLFINNFLKNKKYHQEFLGSILNEINYGSFQIEEEKGHFYSQKELEDILKNYYQEYAPDSFSIYQNLIQDHRLITIPAEDENDYYHLGITYIDVYHNTPFVIAYKFNNDIEYLGTLVHEIGHIEDISKISDNRLLNYSEKSIYPEVNSLYREKRFYEFLIRNNIDQQYVKSRLLLELDFTIEELAAVILLCRLPDKYLKRSKYKKMNNQQIDRLVTDLTVQNITYNREVFQEIDIMEELSYSYGQVLSYYFLENPDQYSYFVERKYDLFEQRLFTELGITSEKIIKILQKNRKIIDNKK